MRKPLGPLDDVALGISLIGLAWISGLALTGAGIGLHRRGAHHPSPGGWGGTTSADRPQRHEHALRDSLPKPSCRYGKDKPRNRAECRLHGRRLDGSQTSVGGKRSDNRRCSRLRYGQPQLGDLRRFKAMNPLMTDRLAGGKCLPCVSADKPFDTVLSYPARRWQCLPPAPPDRSASAWKASDPTAFRGQEVFTGQLGKSVLERSTKLG